MVVYLEGNMLANTQVNWDLTFFLFPPGGKNHYKYIVMTLSLELLLHQSLINCYYLPDVNQCLLGWTELLVAILCIILISLWGK